jgi:hypothetical protein
MNQRNVSFEMRRRRKEAVIKMRLKEVAWEGMGFFHLVELLVKM